jgi:hypothetical protein
MYAVEVYAAVRQFVFVEGNSKRKAARVFGLARETVDKICAFSVPPGYQRTRPPEKRKLGAFLGVIDAILASDLTAPPKQRHTSKRILERLRDEHGFIQIKPLLSRRLIQQPQVWQRRSHRASPNFLLIRLVGFRAADYSVHAGVSFPFLEGFTARPEFARDR